MFFGIAIALIGLVFLLENLGVISSGAWQIVWPCLLIAMGLCMVFKKSCHCMCGCHDKGK